MAGGGGDYARDSGSRRACDTMGNQISSEQEDHIGLMTMSQKVSFCQERRKATSKIPKHGLRFLRQILPAVENRWEVREVTGRPCGP